MMSRVELKDDIMTKDLPGRIHSQHKDQTVIINMKDGRSVSDTIETAVNTLLGHEIDVKFEANASKVVMLCISEIGNPRQWRLYNSQLWMNMICLASSLMIGSITSISSKG